MCECCGFRIVLIENTCIECVANSGWRSAIWKSVDPECVQNHNAGISFVRYTVRAPKLPVTQSQSYPSQTNSFFLFRIYPRVMSND